MQHYEIKYEVFEVEHMQHNEIKYDVLLQQLQLHRQISKIKEVGMSKINDGVNRG